MSSIESQAAQGLSSAAALAALREHGPNELPGTRPRRVFRIVVDVLTEPMLLLLIAACSIYIVLGEAREAIVLSASMVIVVAISVSQEWRTEHSLSRLRELASPRALVIRDGNEQRIDSRHVVPGDAILLREGDRVPADAQLETATALSVDESILTGESLAVDKSAEPTAGAAERLVFSGSLIVRGYGMARVVATGLHSEIGKIGHALGTLQTEATPLSREVHRMVRWVASIAIAVCVVVAVIYGATRNDWLGGALAGVTLAMGALPEEIPLVLTIFLALGAWRMSRHGVLTRRMPAIEAMGAVTVLAVDKTGTLTENRMRVASIVAGAQEFDLRRNQPLDPAGIELLATALAASERKAFDPMERAIHEAAALLAPAAQPRLDSMQLVREFYLTPQLLAVTHVWQRPDSASFEVAIKGAPEAVLRLCQLSPEEREMQLARTAALARDGLRVLAVAAGTWSGKTLPAAPADVDVRLLGLLCLADPLRADVPRSLNECTQAGIRVIMITGDHPGTAAAIAAQAGFATPIEVLTGAQVDGLDDEALGQRLRTTSVFARMSPAHKLRLVQALKANGDVVAMTGDGVNDAPALKAAHIGVAMGGRGTDVAREAAAIVLLNDDFTSLVNTVRSGRRIYDNLAHAMSFIVAIHVPIAGMGLLPVLLGWPLLLLPMHVLFLEFVIDPACTFVFEADEQADDIMRRKPRPPGAPLFSAAMMRRSLGLGTVVLVFVAGVYAVTLATTNDETARASSFAALVIANLALILVNRSPGQSFQRIVARHNSVYWLIATAASVALAIAIYVPAIAQAFRFAGPAPLIMSGIVVAAAATVVVASAAFRELQH
jgi:Ca2+-transporting ATPase